jgi:hypothetical protein
MDIVLVPGTSILDSPAEMSTVIDLTISAEAGIDNYTVFDHLPKGMITYFTDLGIDLIPLATDTTIQEFADRTVFLDCLTRPGIPIVPAPFLSGKIISRVFRELLTAQSDTFGDILSTTTLKKLILEVLFH